MTDTVTVRNSIIFTDLDGTLLDYDSYVYMKALPAIDLIKQEGVPLIFCSSKTRAEQLFYRRKLGCKHPFIIENGAAIYIEENYFPLDFTYQRSVAGFKVIELGVPYHEVRRILDRVRIDTGLDIIGYGDTNAETVAGLTGLDIESAGRAMQREYEETILSELSSKQETVFRSRLSKHGMKLIKGSRFYSVSGPGDKGQAAAIVADLYRQMNRDIHVIGIGDSFNDVPLLRIADIPVIVQKPGATWENVDVPGIQKISGVGPEGWNNFIMTMFAK